MNSIFSKMQKDWSKKPTDGDPNKPQSTLEKMRADLNSKNGTPKNNTEVQPKTYFNKVANEQPIDKPIPQQTTGNVSQPVEVQPQIESRQFIVPKKFDYQITGNSIDEVNSKILAIKKAVPEVELIDNNGLLGINQKGNQKIHEKIYRFLNNVPEPATDKGIPEYSLPEQNISDTQTPETTETTVSDVINPLLNIALNPALNPVERTQDLMKFVDNAKNRYGDNMSFDIAKNFDKSMVELHTEFKTATDKIEQGYNQKDFTKLFNGISGLAMGTMNVPFNLINSLPAGKIVSDLAMIEPIVLGENVGKVLDGLFPDMNADVKELITNVTILGGLHFKGSLMKEKSATPKRIEEIKLETQNKINSVLDNVKKTNPLEVLKEKLKDENLTDEQYTKIEEQITELSKTKEPIDINTTQFAVNEIKKITEIELSKSAIQDAINKYDTELKQTEQKLRDKSLNTKELDELEKEYSRLEQGKGKYQERLNKLNPEATDIKTVSETGTTTKPEPNVLDVTKPLDVNAGLKDKGEQVNADIVPKGEVKPIETPKEENTFNSKQQKALEKIWSKKADNMSFYDFHNEYTKKMIDAYKQDKTISQDFVKELGLSPDSPIDQVYKKLKTKEIVDYNGNEYNILDPVDRGYLSNEYRKNNKELIKLGSKRYLNDVGNIKGLARRKEIEIKQRELEGFKDKITGEKTENFRDKTTDKKTEAIQGTEKPLDKETLKGLGLSPKEIEFNQLEAFPEEKIKSLESKLPFIERMLDPEKTKGYQEYDPNYTDKAWRQQKDVILKRIEQVKEQQAKPEKPDLTEKNIEKLSTMSRNQLPKNLDNAIKEKAIEFKQALETSSKDETPAFSTNINHIEDSDGFTRARNEPDNYGVENKRTFSGLTINTNPDWFRNSGMSKANVINALDRIISGNDHKGRPELVTKLRKEILDELHKGRDYTSDVVKAGVKETHFRMNVPKNEEISNLINQFKEKDINKRDLHKASKPIKVASESTSRIISVETVDKARMSFKELPDSLKINPADFYASKVKDLSIIAGYHIENGIRNFADFSKKMIEEVGDWIKPHLRKLWATVNDSKAVEKLLQTRPDAELNTMGISWNEYRSKHAGEKPLAELKKDFELSNEVTKGVKTEVKDNTPRPIKGSVTRTIEEQDKGFNVNQKIVFETFNPFEPFTRYEKDNVASLPTIQARNYLKKQSYASKWIEGTHTPIIQKDGNVIGEKGSVKDLAKMTKGKETEFAEYLVARRVVEDNNKLVELSKAEQTPEVQARIEKIQGQLEIDNFDLTDAQKVVNENKGTFTQAEKFYDDLNRRLIDFSENTGLISKENADLYRNEKGYASFKRDMSDENSPLFISTNAQSKLSSMKERTGSQRKIIDPVFNLKNAIVETTGKGLENNVWKSLADLSQKEPSLMERFPEVKEESKSTLKVWDNGKVRYFEPAPEFKAVWETMHPKDRGAYMQILRIPTNILTRLTTSANPLFPLRNLTVDQVSAMQNTKTGLNPFHTLKNAISLFTDEGRAEFKRFKNIGGERTTFASSMEMNPEGFTKRILGTGTPKEQAILKAQQIASKPLEFLEIPSNFTEMITRFTEFERAKKKGMPDVEALNLASEITVPFELRGNMGGNGLVKDLVASIPYANAQLQVLYKTMRAVRDNPVRMATVTGSGILVGMGLANLTMLYGTEDQKRELSQMPVMELARNMYIPKPSGKGFIKLRVPESIGSILAMGQLATFSSYNKRVNKWIDYPRALSQLVPNQLNFTEPVQMAWSWLPQIAKPLLETGLNLKSYPEFAPIVPEYMRSGELPKEQYTEYSTRVGKFIGELTNSSPMLIDHFIKSTFGQTGSLIYGLPESLDKLKNPLGTQSDKFIMSGVAYNEFYEKKSQLLKEYNYAKDGGDVQNVIDIARQKALYDKVADVLSDARKVLKTTKELPDETKTQMFELMLNLQKGTDETQIITELADLSKQVEGLKKANPIKSNNKQFTKASFEENFKQSKERIKKELKK